MDDIGGGVGSITIVPLRSLASKLSALFADEILSRQFSDAGEVYLPATRDDGVAAAMQALAYLRLARQGEQYCKQLSNPVDASRLILDDATSDALAAHTEISRLTTNNGHLGTDLSRIQGTLVDAVGSTGQSSIADLRYAREVFARLADEFSVAIGAMVPETDAPLDPST